MPSISGKTPVKRAQIGIVVTRADGRVDDYGIVASSSLWFRLIGRHLAAWRTRQLNKHAQET